MLTKKADITREALHNSFYELLKEKRYEDIKVKDITEHAFTSRANFYYYYKNKEEMMLTIFYELKRSIRVEMNSRIKELKSIDINDETALYKVLYPSILKNMEYIKNNIWIFILDKRANDFNFIDILAQEHEVNVIRFLPENVEKYNSPDFIKMNCLFYSNGAAAIIDQWIGTDMQMPIKMVAMILYLQLRELLALLQESYTTE